MLRQFLNIREPEPKGADLALNKIFFRRKIKRIVFQKEEIQREEDYGIAERMQFFNSTCDYDSQCLYDNEMLARKEYVDSYCKSHPYLYDQLDIKRLLYLKYRKLIWCPVFKAASTNWMNHFPRLSNFAPQQLKVLWKRLLQPNNVASFRRKTSERHCAIPRRIIQCSSTG